MDFQPLHYIFKGTGNTSAKTLLLLHGTGGDENDLVPLAKNFGNDINILSLRGNVNENGMPRFFRRLGMGIFDEKDLEFRTHEMVHFLKEIAKKEGFDSTKIIALGYSNGANIAGATIFLHPDFLAGAILYRPMQPFKNILDGKSNSHTPLFFSSGKNDPTVNIEDTNKYLKTLNDNNLDVTFYEINTGHNLTQEDLKLSVDWFKKNF
ncbi:alpha/beta hydrolase [Flavobacterium granuli]|uniref:Phospholipase/carboxylesterase n=1 Tax=Flavobacterium granuli TaxID=280093 RepID=A0ABU1S3S9_9FLAO|nr:alpha/beta hydrolase [Flavobacterium granuli]MDR6845702.1 phospholipase/carboxylesterase [Flavobacterium granuli]